MLKKLQPGSWMTRLTNAQLRRVAVLVGAPCSGTKLERVRGIEQVINEPSPLIPPAEEQNRGPDYKSSNEPIRLVSIDMGIRNLAYACFSVPVTKGVVAEVPDSFAVPCLTAWERLSISSGSRQQAPQSSAKSTSDDRVLEDYKKSDKADRLKESFEPGHYASLAYGFIRQIVSNHQPTHILIERQRFRSGGGSAVQEWTIRVGVFEGMLYAVLKTLAEEKTLAVSVQGMQPTTVNRYWIESANNIVSPIETTKLTGRELKKFKIDMVGKALSDPSQTILGFNINDEARPKANEFLSSLRKESQKTTNNTSLKLLKLDDMADSLLQGLAWIKWHNNRAQINQSGASNSLDLDSF